MRLILLILTLLTVISPTAGQTVPAFGAPPEAKEKTGSELVKVSLLADSSRLKAGEEFLVAVQFEIEPQWHIYWRNAGQTGMPPVVKLKLPAGFTQGEIQWPRPRLFGSGDELSYGYEKSAALLIPVTIPPTWTGEVFEVYAAVSWLVCKNVCLKGEAEIALQLTPGPAATDVQTRLEKYASLIPKPMAEFEGARPAYDGHILVFTGPASALTPGFIPDYSPGVTFGEPELRRFSRGYVLRVTVQIAPQNALGKEMRVGGLLTFGSRPEDPSYELNVPAEPTRHK